MLTNRGEDMCCSFFSVARAIVVRIVFIAFCFVSAWRVVVSYESDWYWFLLALNFGIVFETYVTIRKNNGEEWKWFSPAIFSFLAACLPCLWLLELHLMELRHEEVMSIYKHDSSDVILDGNLLFGVKIPIYLDDFGWALALEQSLLLILICCRWTLPRGQISRDQLSQILLVHIGMAADILELFAVFNEEKVLHNPALIFPTLALWTLSLFQYSLVITSSKARRSRFVGIGPKKLRSKSKRRTKVEVHFATETWNTDIIGVVSTVVLQDLPFFIFRIYLLSGLGIISHTMIFFTCKNALVVFLQIHRLHVVYTESKKILCQSEDGTKGRNKATNEKSKSGVKNKNEFDTISYVISNQSPDDIQSYRKNTLEHNLDNKSVESHVRCRSL